MKHSIFDPDQRSNLIFVISLFLAFLLLGLASLFIGSGGDKDVKRKESAVVQSADETPPEAAPSPGQAPSIQDIEDAVQDVLRQGSFTFSDADVAVSTDAAATAGDGKADQTGRTGASIAVTRRVSDERVREAMRAKPALFRVPASYELQVYKGTKAMRDKVAAEMRRGVSFYQLSRTYGSALQSRFMAVTEMSPALTKAMQGTRIGSVVTWEEGSVHWAARVSARSGERRMSLEEARDMIEAALATSSTAEDIE